MFFRRLEAKITGKQNSREKQEKIVPKAPVFKSLVTRLSGMRDPRCGRVREFSKKRASVPRTRGSVPGVV